MHRWRRIGGGGTAPQFLTSTLNGGSDQLHAPAALSLDRKSRTIRH